MAPLEVDIVSRKKIVSDEQEIVRKREKEESHYMHPQDDFAKDVEVFKAATIFTAKCYTVDVCQCGRKVISYMLTAIFDTGVCSNLIRKEESRTDSTHDMRRFHSSLRLAGDSAFKVDGIVQICVDLGDVSLQYYLE